MVNQFDSYKSLKNLFELNITVNSIAEEIQFCNKKADALHIKQEMIKNNFDVMGVKAEEMVGYITKTDLSSGNVENYLKPFTSMDLISDSTPLLQVLHILKDNERIFILEGVKVSKIVTYADLQKPPVRMMIFGYITLLEMKLGELINNYFPNQSWKESLSQNRLDKAETLFNDKREKNEDLSLIECLQISDKLDLIFVKDDKLRALFDIPSKSYGKDLTKNIRKLRDEIAHANELGFGLSWKEIISVLEKIKFSLEKIENLNIK